MINRPKDLNTVSDTIHMESKTAQSPNSHLYPGGSLFFHEIARKEIKNWRMLDIFFGTILILFALPFAPFIWLLIRLTSKGPGFQKISFTGFRGKTFTGFQFRTTIHQPVGSIVFVDSSRTSNAVLTPVGRFLRMFNLQRMPLLLNLISGDMSLAGTTLYAEVTANRLNNQIPWFFKSFAIKPGIFSLAEVNGFKSLEPDTQTGMIQSSYDIAFALNRNTSWYLKTFFLGIMGFQDSMPVPLHESLVPDVSPSAESASVSTKPAVAGY